MMRICLFEDDKLSGLFPILHTKAVYQLRLGARTLYRRICDKLGHPTAILHTRSSLADHVAGQMLLPVNRLDEDTPVLFINGRIISAQESIYKLLLDATSSSNEGRLFMQGDDVIAAWVPNASSEMMQHDSLTEDTFSSLPREQVEGVALIQNLWHLLDYLHDSLVEDLADLTRNIKTQDRSQAFVHTNATLINPTEIYLSPSVEIHPGAILNASNGPIYLDENAKVMESAIVKGPVYIGRNSVVKAQTNIEESAVGPVCKVAGEIHSVLFQSYSNKAHAGFAGNTYIGSWCNLGADTNTSNLRNDYAPVTLYNESLGLFESTNRQFLGLIMGDHSKCGINTMFNTGTVVGISSNLYGSGFQPRYVPSFSWGCPEEGLQPYRIDKAIEVAQRVMARRKVELSEAERLLLQNIFDYEHNKVPIS